MTNLRSLVCDLDGVLYLGMEPVPGAGEALSRLDGAGLDIWFVTNNSTKSPTDVVTKITDLTGYPATTDQVLTSAIAAAHHAASGASSALVMGGPGLVEAAEAEGLTVVDASDVPLDETADVDVVLVGLDYRLTYSRLTAASKAIRAGARFVASNGDATFPTPTGQSPGAGSMVSAVEKASGMSGELCGKPHRPMRRLLADRLAPGPVLVVGDRVDTDLELGWAEGWATALVLTGVGRVEHADGRHIDHVLDSIADLPDALGLPAAPSPTGA